MEQDVFKIKIGGLAGQGIKSSGLMLAKIATRSGFNIYNYLEYQSLIRGGHNSMQISISKNTVFGPSNKNDFLIALNSETIDLHLEELSPGSSILFDESIKVRPLEGFKLFPIPFLKLANEAGGTEILSNTIALGASIALLGGDLKIFLDLINEGFASKTPEVAKINQKAAELGFNFALEKFAKEIKKIIPKQQSSEIKMITEGTEAIAVGAIAGGVEFAAIYPMSPIGGLLHFLALYQEKYGFIFKQPEDEISAINMSIGASYAGARSMTATSGGGFSLMTEGYGLAGMTETPLVIVEGMRPGPATGLPTWSGQGDLQFILHAHQGDFPRLVLAAGDAKEAFELTMNAFNLADKYQTPVVIVVDKNICEHAQSFPIFDISSYSIDRGKFTKEKTLNYERYKTEADGISQRSIPGTGNFFITNSYEHDSSGFSTEDENNINSQMEKRMTKLKTAASDMPIPQLFGPEDADVTIVSWGSNKGSILEALKVFNNVNFLHLTWLNPFPSAAVKERLEKSRHVIDIECNYTGQLASLIKEKTGIEIKDLFLKFDGRPFFNEEIVDKINSVLKKS